MNELSVPWLIFPLFFAVAFLYSTVGHGGASGYLALFALFGTAWPSLVPIALILNVLVASVSFLQYRKSGFFSLNSLLPFIVTSVPAAYIGGLIPISTSTFSLALGTLLLLAAARMFLLDEIETSGTPKEQESIWKWGAPIGCVLGFLSGLTGIGGGVFLSPLLLFLRWADARQSAAISSGFIVLNSLSGLGGHLSRSNVDLGFVVPFAFVVVLGGFTGSKCAISYLRPRALQTLLGLVLFLASVKLYASVF